MAVEVLVVIALAASFVVLLFAVYLMLDRQGRHHTAQRLDSQARTKTLRRMADDVRAVKEALAAPPAPLDAPWWWARAGRWMSVEDAHEPAGPLPSYRPIPPLGEDEEDTLRMPGRE